MRWLLGDGQWLEGRAPWRLPSLGPIDPTDPVDPVDPVDPPVTGPIMPAFTGTETAALAGHSSVMELLDGGDFSNYWTGTIRQNIIGGVTHSSDIWAANGPERTNPFDFLVISEMDEAPDGRYAAPDSAQGIINLQNQYYFGELATANDAPLILFWQVTSQASWSVSHEYNKTVINYYRQWLSDKLGRTVYVLPVDLYVGILRQTMADSAIWQDNFHLSQIARKGVGYMLGRVVLGVAPPVEAGEEVVHAAAMQALAQYRWGGTGGSGNDEIITVASDPLPNPLSGNVAPPTELVALRWSASEYVGPALAGTEPTIDGEVMNFPGTGSKTNNMVLPNGAYMVASVRYPGAVGGVPLYLGGDAYNFGADPYFALETFTENFVAMRYNGPEQSMATGAPHASNEWFVLEYWAFGNDIAVSVNGVDVVVTTDFPTPALPGLALFDTGGIPVQSTYVEIRSEMPSAAEREALRAEATVLPAPPPPIDAVVMMGASLKNSMFGKSLTTPHAAATNLLAAAGHNLPVYGWATNGAQLDDAVLHYNQIRAAFPNALILCHLVGGGNVTSVRPYPGGQSEFNTRLAQLAAAAEGDDRFYPASITFRDYDDTTFITPANGSKPYNENIVIPWIAANFPHAIGAGGRPKLDYYRRVLESFESWLVADNIHLTSTGISEFRQWIIARTVDLLNGVTPAEITERVYVAPPTPEPEPQPTQYPLSIINFTGEGYNAQAPRNNVMGNSATLNPNPLTNILDVNGNPTGLRLSHGYTGNPALSPTAPGRGANPNGNVGSLPSYNGTLLSASIVGASAYVTSGVTMLLTISGAVPGAQYEFGMVGSRNAADVRNTRVTIAGTPTIWNTSEATPQERRVTVTAAADGTIPIVVATEGSTYAYLGGLSIRRLAA